MKSAQNRKINKKVRREVAVGTRLETIPALRGLKNACNANKSPPKSWSLASPTSAKPRLSIASAKESLSMSQVYSQIRNLCMRNREICRSAWIITTHSLTSRCACMTVQAITALRTFWIYTGRASTRSFSSTVSIAFRALIACRTG